MLRSKCGQKLPNESGFCTNCCAKLFISISEPEQTQYDFTYSYVPPKGSAKETICEPKDAATTVHTQNVTRVYCNSCGAEWKEKLSFCTQCGAAVAAVQNVGNSESAAKNQSLSDLVPKVQKSVLRIIEWILLVFNAFGALGCLSNGTIPDFFRTGGIAGFFMLLGSFWGFFLQL